MRRSSMKSSSMVCIPLIPFPPRFWLLKLSTDILLMYPRLVMAITVSSSEIRSSTDISSSKPIFVRLSSPYFSEITRISFLITPNNLFSSARIARNSAILASSSLYSFSSFSRSRPVRARRRMSTIACACGSVSSKHSMRTRFASATFAEPRMILITSSI